MKRKYNELQDIPANRWVVYGLIAFFAIVTNL